MSEPSKLIHSDSQPASGLVVVISGPSGVGKTTITEAMIERFDAVFSVSATTRPRTIQDVPGRSYVFMDEAQFTGMIERGEFLEFARVFDQYYGTPHAPVDAAVKAGRIVLLEIDVQGAIQVRDKIRDAFMMFILPPSEESLLDRLRARRRDSEENIRRRFQDAKDEISLSKSSGVYDRFITNDSLDRAIEEATAAIEEAWRTSQATSS